MDEQFYEKLEQDYKAFYCKKVKPFLPEYEEMRKTTAILHKRHISMFVSISIFFVCLLLSDHFAIFAYFAPIFFFLFLIFFISTFFVKGKYSKRYDTFLPLMLKDKFMEDFLKIFSEFSTWKSRVSLFDGYFDKCREYKKLNIFNFYYLMLFDDVITLDYKGIGISIYETNTSNLLLTLIPFILSLGLFQGCGILFVIGLFIFVAIVIPPLFFIAVFIFIIVVLSLIIKLVTDFALYAPFRGAVVEFDFNKSFTGHTFFLNKSVTSKKIAIDRKKFNEVKLESVDFSKKYSVFSTDQVEARYLLTTAMMERLENLKLSFKANFIRGAFIDHRLILAIDTGKNMFEMGSVTKETNIRSFKHLFDEIISIMKIVDQLKLNDY